MPERSGSWVGRVPGRIVASAEKGAATVLTGDGELELMDVQLQDEASTPAGSVLRSLNTTLGPRQPRD